MTSGEPAAPAVQGGGPGLRSVPVSSIEPNRYQPRRVFDQEQLRSLGESLRRSGMMQPVVLRPWRGADGSIDISRYELVAGERRWRAAMLAELASIPAIVRDLSDREAAEWAVIENVQRADLNPIERAEAYRALADRFGLTHAEIGERVGMERSSVANFIRLADLEPKVRELIAGGQLSAGHGKVLLGMAPGAARVELAERAAAGGWNVRQLEVHSKPHATPTTDASAGIELRHSGVQDLERRLGEFLGTKVRLHTNTKGTRGRMVVEFYGLDHFDGLMSRIGFRSV